MKQKHNDFEDFYPLSPLQQGLLFHALEAPHSGVYCEQKATELRGQLDVRLLLESWQRVAERHAVLRTAFAWQGLKEPVQTVARKARAPWHVLDWTRRDPASRRRDSAALEAVQLTERQRGFDLRRAPLFRLLLVRLAADRHILIWTHHHLLLDGWSVPLVLREVFRCYQGLSARGQVPKLPPVRPFKHYVAWLRKQRAEDAEAFWRRTLGGVTEPTPLPDRAVAAPPDRAQAESLPAEDGYADVLYRLDAERQAALQSVARRQGATFSSVVQAAWTLLLSRYADRDDVLFGLVTSGRPPQLPGVEDMVGLFINTLPVRERIERGDTWGTLLQRLQAQGAERQAYGYESLATVQGWSDVPRGRPLFDSLLVLETFPVDALQVFHEAELELESLPQVQRTHYPLTLLVVPGEDLLLHLVLDTRRLEPTFGHRLMRHFDRLLSAVADTASLGLPRREGPQRDGLLRAVSLLMAAEQHQLLLEWSDARSVPRSSLAGQIAAHAARQPDGIALVDASGVPAGGTGAWAGVELVLSYGELARRSSWGARRLARWGAGSGTLVALAAERGADAVIAILATLRSGASYVPLDTSLPAERLRWLLDAVRPSLLLADEASFAVLEPLLDEGGGSVRCLDLRRLDLRRPDLGAYPEPAGAEVAIDGPRVTIDGEPAASDPVYLLHTSGSTGTPKGVWLGHGALANMLHGCDGYDLPYRTLQLAAYGFDISFMEVVGTWHAGGTLVLASEEERVDAVALLELVATRAVERVTFPVVLLQQVAELALGRADATASPRTLRRLASTGEALRPTPALDAWLRTLRADVRFDNLYGPTETHVITEAALPPRGLLKAHATIGRPLAACAVYVIDRHGRALPLGSTGELMLGGAAVALGYFGRPRLTAERFVPDCWSRGQGNLGEARSDPPAGARVYRSGDLGRHLPDGRLEYLGRVDHQLKVRGFRVEPGEIEAALVALSGVTAAAVVSRQGRGASSAEVSLIAFVVLAAGSESQPDLRVLLAERLPVYMVPAHIEVLDALPLNRNRKVDRRELTARALQLNHRQRLTAPRTPTEELLCGLWGEVLGCEVGIEDDFFALGGHSLLAMRLLGQVQARLGVELPVSSLFEEPTVGQQAQHVEASLLQDADPAAAAASAPPLRPRARGGGDHSAPPLSFAQERLWFLDRLEPGSSAYNIAVAVELHAHTGTLRAGAFFAAAQDIVRRHQVLHTRYREIHGTARQLVAVAGEAASRPGLALVDLTALPEGERRSRMALLGVAENRRPFDLTSGPVLRLTLVKLSAAEHVVLLTVHHIAGDGWSMGIFLRELAAFYGARVDGRMAALPPLPVQYADFAVWQRQWLSGAVLEAQLDYWRRRLADLPARLELPADRPRAHVGGASNDEPGAVLPLRWSAALSARLAELARQRGATLYMVLLAGFLTVLGRLTGRRDPVVGSPIAGRRHAAVEDLVGFFVNTLVMRGDLGDGPTFVELLRRVRTMALEAYAHQDLPFEKLVEELAPERDLEHAPLFQVMFALQNTPLASVEVAGLELRPPLSEVSLAGPGAAKFDLSLLLTEVTSSAESGARTRIEGVLEYRPERFDATSVRRLERQLRTLLEAALDAPKTPLEELPLLDAASRQQLLHEWVTMQGLEAEPGAVTVDELVRAQAAATPDAVAVVDPQGSGSWLSYRELDRRANALAAFVMRELPARETSSPEPIVALALERRPSLVVALIAVLRAGAAYLPVEPDQPLERLAFLLQDANVRLALVEHAGALPELPGLRQLPREMWALSTALAARIEEPSPPSPRQATGLRLAYLMYTSGSTGRPKGVAVPHQGIVRLVRQPARSRALGFTADDVFLQLAPVGFDASTLELWAPLTRGGRLVLYPHSVPEVDRLQRILAEQDVSALWLTAGLFHQLVEERPTLLRGVRRLLTGGDVVSAEHARRVLEELPDLQLIDGYGPTENTTFTTCHPIRDADVAPEVQAAGGTIPIGRPLAGTTVVVLDRAGRPAPVGVPGELCTGGAGLARGYFGRPALTAEKFVPCGEAASESACDRRLYRTGDLARWRADGRGEFLGRVDTQVKLRGFRIEPGEIEATLLAHPRVAQAAVVLLGEDAASKRLEAAIAGQELAGDADVSAILTWVRARLPEYMVPSALHPLPELPLTDRGKVDRRRVQQEIRQQLAAAAEAAGADGGAGEPRTAVERRMARLWAELLGRTSVGVDDDFFGLGGHSLLAMRLVARVRQAFGVELPVRSLFEAPTVVQLSKVVEAGANQRKKVTLPPLRRVPRTGSMPLSFAQERLWFLSQLDPLSPAYNIPMALHLVGELDPRAFSAALTALVQRHEVLRTRFASVDGRPIQKIGQQISSPLGATPPASWLQVAWLDVRGLPRQAQLRQLWQLTAGAAQLAFDLARGPVLKVTLVRGLDEPEDGSTPSGSTQPRLHHAALLTLHHIAGDGWSLGVLVRELGALYRQQTSGGDGAPAAAELPELPVQYADFAVWQRSWLRGPLLEQQLAWWREQLRELPPLLELPTDRPRPAVANLLSVGMPVRLGAPRTAKVKALARAQGSTLFMASLAAFLVLLGRLTGRRDPVVGSPIAGRRHPAVENLIGFFVNTLVLRTDLGAQDGAPLSFSGLLARVRRTTLEAYAHQDLPFEKLVEELAPQRSLAYAPLFQVMFALQNAPFEATELPDLELQPLGDGGGQAGMAKFDLSLLLHETQGSAAELAGELEYCLELFDASSARRMIGQYEALVDAVLAAPEAPLSSLDLLAGGERHQLLVEWGHGPAPGAGPAIGERAEATGSVAGEVSSAAVSVIEVFLRQVTEVPDAVALVLPASDAAPGVTRHLSYGELARRSGELAVDLQRRGVGPDVIVGLCFERSLEQLVALIAIQRAGGAYLPLDPQHPEARRRLVLEDAGVEVVLEDSGDTAHPCGCPPGLGTAESDPRASAQGRHMGLPLPRTESDQAHSAALAYVMYTSGSTGRPKGVACYHAGLLRLVLGPGAAAFGGFGRRATWLQLVPTGFDVSTLEMWGALLHGARLVLAPERVPSLDSLASVLAEQRVDRLWLSSGLFQQVVDERPRALDGVEVLFSGGDVVPLGAARKLLQLRREAGLPLRLVNGYGPTENAVLTSAGPVSDEAALTSSVPIGRPLPGTSVHILGRVDAAGGFFGPPVGVGVVGELVTGGLGLARGYLGRPALTAEVFLPDPFSSPARGRGRRLYRTGDLARWLPDGRIEFLGRRDQQVQLRGFRIEPGEIEALLAAHEAVRAAAVLVSGETSDDKRLVAYVVPEADLSAPLNLADLRSYLTERLPGYMVPAAFDVLDTLPVTANGKLDRRALRARRSEVDDTERTRRALPASELERLLAELWGELLLVDDVRREDDFFQLGGHSLLGMRLLARLRERLDVDLPVRTLFENSTLAGLAERLQSELGGELPPGVAPGSQDAAAPGPRRPPLNPRSAEEDAAGMPLSFAQERLWFLDQLTPGTAVYNIPAAFRLHGRIDVLAFQRAAEAVARRHEVLRTRFVQVAGEGMQRVESRLPPLLQLTDIQGAREAERDELLRQLALGEARGGFDLADGPVLRLRLVRLASREHALLLTLHHIAGDGWSMGVLMKELLEIYDARLSRREPDLLPLEVQYADFSLWQRRWLRGAVLRQQLDFWKAQLAGLPPRLELPIDRPRPSVRSVEGATLSFQFEAPLVAELRGLSERAGMTLFMTLLAGFQLLLGRHAQQCDFALGSPVAGRVHPAVEPLIGFFINTLVLRARIDGSAGFQDHLLATRQTVLEAFAHQDLPFEKLVEELVPQRELSHTPLFQVLFVLQNTPMPELKRPDLRLEALRADTATSKFDLTLGMTERGSDGGLHADFEYRPDLFDATTLRRMAGQLRELLAAAVADPARPTDRLPLLSAAERHQLAVEVAAPILPYVGRHESGYLPARFLLYMIARADAVALVVEGAGPGGSSHRLTYRRLAERAVALAVRLQGAGVGPEVPVAVCLDRGLDLVIALLGIALAGGAYLPLDPVHPPERLALIVEDARAPLALTNAELRHVLPESGPRVLELREGRLVLHEEDGAAEPWPPAAGPLRPAHPNQTLYLIYTSGSTGVPKGVAVSQFSATRLFDATRAPISRTLDLQTPPLDGSDQPLADTWALFHSYAFDMSVWELWGALAAGGTLVVVPYAVSRDPRAFRRLLLEQRVTVLNQTPSAFYQLVRQEPELGVLVDDAPETAAPPPLSSLHTVVFGGEALDPQALRPWLARYGDVRPRLVNMYGITEITVHATERRIRLADLDVPGQSPIGVPLADLTLQVLDRTGMPVPYGVPGELYVGGPQVRIMPPRGGEGSDAEYPVTDAGLATGYHGRSALTASRFVPDAFSPRSGARLYRSGDLVRRLATAGSGAGGDELVYLGRIDFQVQIRGFRVELGEVEAVIGQHSAVKQAVVLARGEGESQRLVGYAAVGTSVPSSESLSANQLRDFLRQHLPEYMVPAALVLLPTLPLTPNGKVDRRALPEPEADRPDLDVRFQEPRSELETRLAALWREVLELEQVGIYDSFFDLGGHSLLLVRVHEKLEAMVAREVPLLLLFQYPTIATLAEQLQKGADAAKPAAVSEEAVRATEERADDRLQRARRRKQFRQRRRKGR